MRWHPDSGDMCMQHQTNWPELQPVLDRTEEMVPPLPHTYRGLLPVDHFCSGCTLRIEDGICTVKIAYKCTDGLFAWGSLCPLIE